MHRVACMHHVAHHACKYTVLQQKSARPSSLQKWNSLTVHGIGKILDLLLPHLISHMFSCLHVKHGLVWFKGQNIIAWMCTRVMKEMYTAIACVTLCRTHVKPQSKALHLSSMRVHQPRDVLALKSSKSKCVTHPLHTARAHQPCYDWALKSHKFKCGTHPLHIPFILRVHTNPVMIGPLNHTNLNAVHIHYTSPSYCACTSTLLRFGPYIK